MYCREINEESELKAKYKMPYERIFNDKKKIVY